MTTPQTSEELRAELEAVRRAMEAQARHFHFLRQDLESSLSAILGMSDLLLESHLGGEQTEYVQVIRTSAQVMDSILVGMADMTQTEIPAGCGGEQHFDLRLLVEDLADVFRIHAQRTNVTFQTRNEADVPGPVRGYPSQIRRVATCFLHCALAASAGETVSLRVGVHGYVGDRIRLAFVLEGAAASEGSVLRSCLETAAAFGVEARIGEDSRVVRLFFDMALDPASTRAFPPPESIAGLHILAVERNQAWRAVLREYCYLWKCGYAEALDASSALVLLDRAAQDGAGFDFVLLDSHLDGMTPAEFAQRVRRDHPGTRLVMLASTARPGDARAMAQIGFAGYLVKPITRQRLHDTLSLIRASEGADEPPALVTRHVVAEERKQRRAVLAVDDQATNRQVISAVLDHADIAHVVAASGQEALELLARERFAVILLDIEMDGLSGFDTVRIIRDRSSQVLDHDASVIALTARMTGGQRQVYLDAGFTDVLEKPFDVPMFLLMMEKFALRAEEGTEVLPIDLDRLLAQIDQDRDLLREVLHAFVDEAGRRLEQFRAALDAGDFILAREKAHALRGMAGSVRASVMGQRAEQAEQACLRGHGQRCLDMAEAMRREVDAVRNLLTPFVI